MVTLLAIVALMALFWWSERANLKPARAVHITEDEARQSMFETRQSLRLVNLLLAAIFLMLGVIADRLP